MEEGSKEGLKQQEQLLRVLEALKQASHDLRMNPSSSAINALLELETEADTILSTYPNLCCLIHHLSDLKNLIESLDGSATRRRNGLRSFLARRRSALEISRLAASIEAEIQAWIDRERIEGLVKALRNPSRGGDDERLSKALMDFEERVSLGFNRELQDLVLRSRVFAALEQVLCDSKNRSSEVREKSAFAIASLIRFNKDVFVGEVLIGPTIRALISMASISSFYVLRLLIKSIKSPLVDEIECNGQIPKIIAFLGSQDPQIRAATMECVLEIGYYGRKEAIEAMLHEGLIKKLVELQRSELENEHEDGEDPIDQKMDHHAFGSCVARFAVQLEVGEGLRQSEKRAFKQEILSRVREACADDAEAATIVAEVLWGSSP